VSELVVELLPAPVRPAHVGKAAAAAPSAPSALIQATEKGPR
jgi:hypothetical protein